MKQPSADILAFVDYRLRAIDIGHRALQYALSWDSPPSVKIFFGDQQVIEGLATAFTNGAIESAVIHCRALLEFVGLKGNGPSNLAVRSGARGDDYVIESAGLPKVSVQDAVAMYSGPAQEAEAALAHVIHVANKGLAHSTTGFSAGEGHQVEIAFRGVPKLVIQHFYVPLGLTRPKYEIEGRHAV